jgi:hypothetical protein
MRARAISGVLLCATTCLAVSGCPGELDDPQRFQGAGLVACDVRINELFTKTCSTAGCHSGDQPAQGLDLVSPGVEERLIGVTPTGAGCSGVLVDPKNPIQSLLYSKLTELPPCGVPMPFGGGRLSARDLECMRTWIAGLAVDGGASDASTPKDASTTDGPTPPRPDVVVVPPDTGVVTDTGIVRDTGVVKPEAMPPPTGTGLKGEYFDEVDYTSSKLVRTDSTVDFAWPATESPDPAIAADGIYSARWTGSVIPEFGETYTFYAESDDGVRLTVAGDQLFDDQTGHATTEFAGSKALEAGMSYPIELRWFNSQGYGEIRLSWSSASRPRQIIPKERLVPAP